MNFRSGHTVLRVTLSSFLLLLNTALVIAQETYYCGTAAELMVKPLPGVSYTWELYDEPAKDFAATPGNCPAAAAGFPEGNKGPGVKVEWILPGTYFYKVTAWDAVNCTNNIRIGRVEVIETEIEAVISGASSAGRCHPVLLDGSGSKGSPAAYAWEVMESGAFIGDSISSNAKFLLHPSSFNKNISEDFHIILRVAGKYGETDSDTFIVRVNPAPFADFTANNNLENDGSLFFDAAVSTGTDLKYQWSTTNGKIIGPSDRPIACLFGKGIYSLEVTDVFGCKSVKNFPFPGEYYWISANPDYARTKWNESITISVLDNDKAALPISPATVKIIKPPAHAKTKINGDGTISYTPEEKIPYCDQFIYEVCDAGGLCDSAVVSVDVATGDLKIITGFSPNSDGVNDRLVFEGLDKSPGSKIWIYTRSGQLIFVNADYQNDWDGRYTGELVPSGVYYYLLIPGGGSKQIRGYIYIGY